MPARLKSFASWLLVFACGVALGWVVKDKRGNAAQTDALKVPPHETIRIDRPGDDPVFTNIHYLEPHTIHDGESKRQISAPPPPDERSWVILLHGGQVRVFCREINKR